MDSDTRVRAKLVRDGGPDYHSSWFNVLRQWRYTGWYSCYAGCTDTYEVDNL